MKTPPYNPFGAWDKCQPIIQGLMCAKEDALRKSSVILPDVADVAAHPCPAIQDLIAHTTFQIPIKDFCHNIYECLNYFEPYKAQNDIEPLQKLYTAYADFLLSIAELLRLKSALCDTLNKPTAKQKLIDCLKIISNPFLIIDSPHNFYTNFRRALMLDAKATTDINTKGVAPAQIGYTQEDRARDEQTAVNARKAAAKTKADFESKSKGGKRGARTRKESEPPDEVRKKITLWVTKKEKEWDEQHPERKGESYKGYYTHARIYRDAEKKDCNKDAQGQPIFTADQIKEWFKPSKIKRRKGRK